MSAARETVRGAIDSIAKVPRLRRVLRSLTLRGWLPPAVWKRLPVTWDFRVDTTYGSFTYLNVSGDLARRGLHWRGLAGFEPETLRVFEELCRDARVVVDVGANTGVFSLVALASNSTLHVHAFEPVPAIRQVLAANIAANNEGERVTLHEEALSSAAGTAEFILPESELPTSAHLSSAAYRSHEGVRTEVRTNRLDSLLEGTVDVVKIDVEGAEDQVLCGMPRILAEQRPKVIVECLPEGPFRQVQETLAKQGYRFYHLTPRGPSPVEGIVPDRARRLRNFLCEPRAHPS